MKTLIVLILLCWLSNANGQAYQNFELVDKYKMNKLNVKVYFKDPLKEILKQEPGFDNKANRDKYDLLDTYLHENALYIFQINGKDGLSKSYIVNGNKKKLRTKYYFKLDIVNANVLELPVLYDSSIEKTIDKISIGGSFFEHMFLFQTPEGKKAVGKGINIWGYFSLIVPYSDIRNAVCDLIMKDVNGEIPADILAGPELKIVPLFDYQSCVTETVKHREKIITVYEYDSAGNIKTKYPRTEKDGDLYYSSISLDDIGGATSFPFFSASDTVSPDKSGKFLHINSTQKHINRYLKDIKVYKNVNTGAVEKIEATLIIHGYGVNGKSTKYELYLAEFGKVGECFLPKTIKFCSIDDAEYKMPRLVSEINYTLKD